MKALKYILVIIIAAVLSTVLYVMMKSIDNKIQLRELQEQYEIRKEARSDSLVNYVGNCEEPYVLNVEKIHNDYQVE